MPLAQTSPLPTLEEAFGGHSKLMKALTRAQIRSVVPVMLMPREALREFDGIGPQTALYITGALSHYNLMHHQFCQKLTDFVNEQFGCIEDTPIAALHVVKVSSMYESRPVYAPIRLLHFLEEYEPCMVVRDLASLTADDIREILRDRVELGPVIERIVDDVQEINWRLAWWDSNLRIHGITKRNRLRVVNE